MHILVVLMAIMTAFTAALPTIISPIRKSEIFCEAEFSADEPLKPQQLEIVVYAV
jgi:hypothetical protein